MSAAGWRPGGRRLAAAICAAACACALAAPSAGAASGARCPLQSSSSIPAGAAWAFHESGAPSGPHAGVASTYVHGRGGWGSGRASGTICEAYSLAAGGPHDLVLSVSGTARVSPRITRIGHLGAGLALGGTVTASDDPACAVGTRLSVTIFASYYEGHHDSVKLAFRGGCAAYDATFLGSQLYALIAEDGHQVG